MSVDYQQLYYQQQLANQPKASSERFISASSDTIATGTSLTVTFPVDTNQFDVKLHKFYADGYAGFEYVWYFNGTSFSLNQGEYPWGQWIHTDIIIVITNPTSLDQLVSYFIEGWGDLIGNQGG